MVALLSSVWLQWRAGRPRVEVEGAIHTLVSQDSVGTPRFGIDVRNVGTVPVVVTSVGVTYGDGELGVLVHARTLLDERVLPKKLEVGEAVSLSNELDPVVAEFKAKGITGVWARTATGPIYRGKNTANLASFATPAPSSPD